MHDMSFQEKSTWGTLIALVVIGALYFTTAWNLGRAAPEPVAGIASLATAAVFVVLLVVVLVVYHALVAAVTRQVDEDERDRLIAWRAGNIGGLVLGFGVFGVIGMIITAGALERVEMTPFITANLLAAAIWLAELAELASRLRFYRAGV